jgi:EAL and modified HD-GYP domain-containing signal transduction protein
MQVFLARQPIFDRQGAVFAYELLYRGGVENHAGKAPGERGTANVLLNAFGTFGIETVTGGKRAFINVTRDLLVSDYALILPAQLVVLELLEEVEPDREVVAAARTLVQKGYSLALDDFVYGQKFHELLDIAEIVKLDLMALPNGALAAQVDALSPYHRRLLAEKVETHEQYAAARALDFDYFQGYYFSRPVMMVARDLPAATLTAMKSVRQVLSTRGLEELETVITGDLSLSYRLLRLINSAAFGLVREVSSIRQALALLGLVAVKKWFSLILLAEVGTDKPTELLRLSLIRAKMLETLVPTDDAGRSAQAFTVGLFSAIDAFLDRPMAEALEPLHFPEESRDALLHRRGPLGDLLTLVIAYERGEWATVGEEAGRMGLDADAVAATYLDALTWAESALASSR